MPVKFFHLYNREAHLEWKAKSTEERFERALYSRQLSEIVTGVEQVITTVVDEVAPDRLVSFLRAFPGRILFGSDILTSDEHLTPGEDGEMEAKAGSPDEAFDLYASRYWALRTMLETDYHGPSPIADPDLAMIDPDHYDEMDAPPLDGKSLPQDVLDSLYHRAAADLLDTLYES